MRFIRYKFGGSNLILFLEMKIVPLVANISIPFFIIRVSDIRERIQYRGEKKIERIKKKRKKEGKRKKLIFFSSKKKYSQIARESNAPQRVILPLVNTRTV